MRFQHWVCTRRSINLNFWISSLHLLQLFKPFGYTTYLYYNSLQSFEYVTCVINSSLTPPKSKFTISTTTYIYWKNQNIKRFLYFKPSMKINKKTRKVSFTLNTETNSKYKINFSLRLASM